MLVAQEVDCALVSSIEGICRGAYVSYIHVPDSRLNMIARHLWEHSGHAVGVAVGGYVAYRVLVAIQDHLEKHRHDYLVTDTPQSPPGYRLLYYTN